MAFFRGRSNKYNVSSVERRTCDNIVFSSLLEMQVYKQLKLLKRAGEVKDFTLQHAFELLPNA